MGLPQQFVFVDARKPKGIDTDQDAYRHRAWCIKLTKRPPLALKSEYRSFTVIQAVSLLPLRNWPKNQNFSHNTRET